MLPIHEQDRISEEILKDRLGSLLPRLMEECGVSLWLVPCREYGEDPLFATLVPPTVLNASRLSCLAFSLTEGKFRAVNLGRPDLRLLPFYEQGYDKNSGDQWDAITKMIESSGGIAAVNTSKNCALADGLTATLCRELESRLPQGASLVSAENLAIRWLETRTDRELTLYRDAYRIAMGVLEEAYSRDVIRPGITTTTQVEDFIRERIAGLGLPAWFSPDVDLQRRGQAEKRMSGAVIQEGDLLHTDMGLRYLGLCTDTQRLAYVLPGGEGEIPPGILRGLEKCRDFQDICAGLFVPGRRGNEVLRMALEEARGKGLRPMLYTHPIGYYGHSAGPCMGLFDNQEFVETGENVLHEDTCYALELNVTEPVAEWDGQDVCFFLEETVSFTSRGVSFMDDDRGRIYVV